MKVERMSALRTGRLYLQEIFISVRECVNPRAIVRPGRIMSMKNSSDTIKNRTRDLPVYSAPDKSIITNYLQSTNPILQFIGKNLENLWHPHKYTKCNIITFYTFLNIVFM